MSFSGTASTLIFASVALVAACGDGPPAATPTPEPTPSPSPTVKPTPSPSPDPLAVYTNAFGRQIALVIEETYAADGLIADEKRMIELLHTLAEEGKIPNSSVSIEEIEWLIRQHPAGIDGERLDYLTVLYGAGGGFARGTTEFRMAALSDPWENCLGPQTRFNPYYDLALFEFYDRCAESHGVVILVTPAVSDQALVAAKEALDAVLGCLDPEVRERLVNYGGKLVIFGVAELLTSLPTFESLVGQTAGDGRPYELIRGVSYAATDDSWSRATAAVGEEDLLGIDPFVTPRGVTVHELAHLIRGSLADGGFGAVAQDAVALRQLYNSAIDAGLWDGTYAATDFEEYFAELTSALFGYGEEETFYLTDELKTSGVNGAEELRAYDPEAHAFLTNVYPCFAT